jgi:hypothetical protein
MPGTKFGGYTHTGCHANGWYAHEPPWPLLGGGAWHVHTLEVSTMPQPHNT